MRVTQLEGIFGGAEKVRTLRQRLFFVRMRTMVQNRIRALVSQHVVTFPSPTPSPTPSPAPEPTGWS
jgi:hypothetical protein